LFEVEILCPDYRWFPTVYSPLGADNDE